MSKTYKIVATGMLAACALILQIANPILGINTGFGMTIDLVGVPIILALFMFGVEASIEVLALATLFIAIFAPTGIVGALMKFAATAPVIIFAALNMARKGKNPGMLENGLMLVAGVVASALIFALGGWIYSELKDTSLLVFGLLPVLAMAGALFIVQKMGGGKKHDYRIFENSRSFLVVVAAAVILRGVAMIIANYYFAGPLYFKLSPEEFVGYISSTDILVFGKNSAWQIVVFAFNAIQAIAEIAVAWILAYKFNLAKRYSDI